MTLTIKDTTGQDTITCINYLGQQVVVAGTANSVLEKIINGESVISNDEFLVLEQEIAANINPVAYSIYHTPGGSFYGFNYATDLTYNNQTISNVYVGGSAI
jgi:hypothetical protein